MKKVKKWYKLDNAATIYPSVKTRRWMAMFRLCAELSEQIDRDTLSEALKATLKRMPTFAVCVRMGMFWYYLEELDGTPPIEDDVANPCLPIDPEKTNGFMFRIRCHDRRIALEFFHVLADGTGGLTFLKTLVAEYLRLKYGVDIPYSDTVLCCTDAVKPEEIEDSFLRYAGDAMMERSEKDAYPIQGKDEIREFMNIITGKVDTETLLSAAHKYGVSVSNYLTALMIKSICDIQKQDSSKSRKKMPVKICVPVNLRRLFPSVTFRNFASYVNPGIESSYGVYSLQEICTAVKSYMTYEVTPQRMRAKFSANVDAERNPFVRLAPLIVKIPILRAVYRATGDVQTSALMSNLGAVKLPDVMEKYITRLDFQIGPLFQNRVMCAVISYKGTTNINCTRTLRAADTERGFFNALVEDGVKVTVESNLRERSLM